MKNLFLSLVFVLGTATSFAGSNLIISDLTCITVTTSCGIVGTVCDYTTEGLLEGALELDRWFVLNSKIA